MTQIPEPQVDVNTVAEWFKKKQDLAKLVVAEMLLRKRIFKTFFAAPKEGSSNYHTMPDGYRLNATHNVNRKIDEPVMRAMWDDLCKAGIRMNDLIKMKPELNKSEYNTLTEEQRQLFDQVLIISDGSPQLEIKPPSKK